MGTSPKSSNYSWENTKIACLDQKLLTKPALTAEAMWKRDINSDDKLDITYRQQNPPETIEIVATSSRQVVPTSVTGETETMAGTEKKTPSATCSKQPFGVNECDTSDDEFDRQLMEIFPIGAHLPLSNIL